MRALALNLVAFLFVAALGSALLMLDIGNLTDRAFTITLWFPLVWAAAMFYAYWDQKAWRPLTVMSATTVVCAIYIYLAEPLI